MKKLLLLVCVAVVSLGALSAQNSLGGGRKNAVGNYDAQHKGWSNRVELDAFTGIGYLRNYRFSPYIEAGVGANVYYLWWDYNFHNYTGPAFPIYCHFKIGFAGRHVNPFFSARVGYIISPKKEFWDESEQLNGLFLSPQIGVDIGSNWSIGIGIALYDLKLSGYSNENILVGSPRLSIGYTFDSSEFIPAFKSFFGI